MDENKRKRKLVISGSERYEKRNDDSDSAGCVCQHFNYLIHVSFNCLIIIFDSCYILIVKDFDFSIIIFYNIFDNSSFRAFIKKI